MSPPPGHSRPPFAPRLSSTWHALARSAAGAISPVEIAAVGGAFLATDAKRRLGLVRRERPILKKTGCKRHHKRVRALESELEAIGCAIERYKRFALLAGSSARAAEHHEHQPRAADYSS